MRYDPEEALRQTLERAAVLRARNSRRRGLVLSLGAGGCACALLGLGYALVAQGGAALQEADYGAFLLPSHAGGYILAAVLAFAAGVIVTLLCLRCRSGSAAVSAGRPSSGPRQGSCGKEEDFGPGIRPEDPEERE